MVAQTAQGFVLLNVGNMVAQTPGLSSTFSNPSNSAQPLGMPEMHGNPWSFPTSFPFMQQMHSEMVQSQRPTREADICRLHDACWHLNCLECSQIFLIHQ